MSSVIALPGIDQATMSEKIRTILKRRAQESGSLAGLMREAGLPYKRAWNQANRNQGVLVDLIVTLAQHGIDEPLRAIADACNHDVTPKVRFLRKAHPTKPVRSIALDLHHATANVTERIEQALVDNSFDDRDRDSVAAALHLLRKKMAELEARMNGEKR